MDVENEVEEESQRSKQHVALGIFGETTNYYITLIIRLTQHSVHLPTQRVYRA